MSSPKSERQLLFARVHKQKMAESLTRNLSHLSKTEERLSSSRLSSASSTSLQSLRRAYSTVSRSSIKKSSSKQKMLKEIIEKLKHAKFETQDMQREQRYAQQSPRKDSKDGVVRANKVNKLQQMMKDIKKCNQMSTKAVYSIKKNINEQLSSTAEKTKDAQKSTSILLLVNEMANLKQELANIKKENKQLLSIIQQQKDRQCPHCGKHPQK